MKLKKMKLFFPVLISVIIALGLSIAIQSLFAWSPPLNTPPTCNSGDPGCDAPLNTSSTGQSKDGGLIINHSGAAANGLIVENGNVGIGTTNPTAKLTIVTNDNEDSGWYSYNDSDISDFDFNIYRAKGTSDLPLAVTNVNNLGSLTFLGYDGTSFHRAARVEASVDGTPGLNNMPGKLQFYTTPDGSTTDVIRMTIKNDGNVGIGTTAPYADLHIYGDNKTFRIGAGNTVLNASTNIEFAEHANDDGSIKSGGKIGNISTNGQERTFFHVFNNNIDMGGIDIKRTNGYVGIGTTNPSEKLHVVSESRPNAHYSKTEGAVIEGKDVSLQIIGNESSTWKSHVILSGSPDSGNNRHWFISGWGPDSSDRFGIQYMTSAATNFNNPSSTADFFTITTAGNIGIGTVNPNQQLEITKNFRMPATVNAAKNGIIYKNNDIFIHDFNYGNNGTVTTNGENTFVGVKAGNLSMGTTAANPDDSSFNTGVGYLALNQNTKGNHNTAIGNSAMELNTDGYFNTALGVIALWENTTGYANTAIGISALEKNISGNDNTAVGAEALWNNTGNNNTAIGVAALKNNTTGSNNTAIGWDAQVSAGNLTNATAIGYGATANASNKVVIGNSSVTSIGGYAGWSNYSDLRAKTDIQDLGYGLDFIKQLKPVSFKMKNGNGNTDFGFVAQDIEALFGEKYNVLDIGGGDERMLSLRYSQLIAPMVKAIQEQQTQIEKQTETIKGQQKQLNELKAAIEELK